MRGPQTPGELRTRSNRLCEFNNVQETEATLTELADAPKGPFVIKLAREPGKRESRYAHCFADKTADTEQQAQQEDLIEQPQCDETMSLSRLQSLEETVELLQLEVHDLQVKLNECLNKN